jgi:hypothetical protein
MGMPGNTVIQLSITTRAPLCFAEKYYTFSYNEPPKKLTQPVYKSRNDNTQYRHAKNWRYIGNIVIPVITAPVPPSSFVAYTSYNPVYHKAAKKQ